MVRHFLYLCSWRIGTGRSFINKEIHIGTVGFAKHGGGGRG